MPVVVISIFILFDGSSSEGFSQDKYNKFLCDAEIKWNVPKEIILLVILAEQKNNFSWDDDIQNTVFSLLLKNKPDMWWSEWSKELLEISFSSKEHYLLSNKWPNELAISGYVMSIGPAQITPLTAISACHWAKIKNLTSSCPVKTIMKKLLKPETAIDLAGMVLAYEREVYQSHTKINVTDNYPLWATIYNVGGFYYRKSGYFAKNETNYFGEWVNTNKAKIDKPSCS